MPGLGRAGRAFGTATMHYPHRISKLKRKRAIGFRARMKTKSGRKLINRQRRIGRSVNTADR
jgi:large subunit ribosomal protein L34